MSGKHADYIAEVVEEERILNFWENLALDFGLAAARKASVKAHRVGSELARYAPYDKSGRKSHHYWDDDHWFLVGNEPPAL